VLHFDNKEVVHLCFVRVEGDNAVLEAHPASSHRRFLSQEEALFVHVEHELVDGCAAVDNVHAPIGLRVVAGAGLVCRRGKRGCVLK